MTHTGPGATSAEWVHFSLVLGLTDDLLPCVADTSARISPASTLRTIGKVPSTFNAGGDVVGIPQWTSVHATEAQIARWSSNDRLSCCLQTRHVRAIDVDVPHLGLAARVRARLTQLLGVQLPARCRPGSARFAVGVLVDADVAKRVLKLPGDGGAVELLGDGQQLVVAGTHPSGGRYFWDGGLPAEFPRVSAADLERALDTLAVELVCTEAPGRHTAQAGRRGGVSVEEGKRLGLADPVSDWLEQRGWARGPGRKQELRVYCPWASEHTGDSGETETVWWPAGTGGYAQGHFHCLHAHCAGRTDGEFLDAVGWRLSMLDEVKAIGDDDDDDGVDRPCVVRGATGLARPVGGRTVGDADAGGAVRPGGGVAGVGVAVGVVASVAAAAGPAAGTPVAGGGGGAVGGGDPTASWTSGKPGQTIPRGRKGFIATQKNLARALATEGWWRRLGHDTFRDELMWSEWAEAEPQWRTWTDEDYTRARIQLERDGFEPPSRDAMRDAVQLAAREHAFDSAQTWLARLKWDGTPRVAGFLAHYCGALQDEYSRAVSAYLWTAMAGRVLQPGVKADMVPILVGLQGVGKTSGVAALVPARDFTVTIDLGLRDADLARRLRGRLVVEIAELRGLHTRDRQSINDFITAQEDTWVPKYRESASRLARRFVMIGTTNDEEFLADETGNRRWLPVRVAGVDVPAIEWDREHLWAEAAVMFSKEGVAWRGAEGLAPAEHSQYMMSDSWVDAIEAWVDEPVGEELSTDREGQDRGSLGATWGDRGFTIRECANLGLRLRLEQVNRSADMRIASILRKLGYEKRRVFDAGRRDRNVWFKRG